MREECTHKAGTEDSKASGVLTTTAGPCPSASDQAAAAHTESAVRTLVPFGLNAVFDRWRGRNVLSVSYGMQARTRCMP